MVGQSLNMDLQERKRNIDERALNTAQPQLRFIPPQTCKAVYLTAKMHEASQWFHSL